ncbi:hypothetical protein JAO74_09885 [Sphingomonas sp. BT553]|uniref:DUF11 domain-containing protein n=1 Tax=Sphingomonas mollis TaxID=2795726 RepID=A0ABS0XPY2_9SPHN|nr:hypothetical protein [Sphingomonas sp. BT553]
MLWSTTATLGAMMAGMVTAQAHAQALPPAGTAAGTTVSNTAQASYTVNGQAQSTASTTATFVVDRKVNLTVVATDATATSVNHGQTGAVTRFTVTNNTNGTQDFLLSLSQLVPVGILTGTDNFDLSNIRIFVDGNNNGVYDPATDTATYIDELAQDTSRVVFIVGDIPSNNALATSAQVGLEATVATGGAPNTQGTALIPTPLNTLNQDNEIDVVFADNDNDGLLGFDALRNGRGWAYQTYDVTTRNVNLTVTKSATVLSDGVSTLNPKALPGAVVQYCLTVQNATLLTAANNVNLTDILPTTTTYVPGSLVVGSVGTAGVCLIGGVPVADDGSTTGTYGGSYNATTRTVTATIPVVGGGSSVAASFRVTIN